MNIPTQWSANPAAVANQRVYDGSIVYDSGTLQYDGNVSGQSYITQKKVTPWSNQTNQSSGTQWSANPNIGTVDVYDSSTDSFDGGGSTSAFDSYDDLASGQSYITQKKSTSWTVV